MACPSCGARGFMPVLWGYPTREALEAAERGEVLLAGCMVEGGEADRACRACGRWYRGPGQPL